MEDKDQTLKYTPKAKAPKEQIASLAEAIKSKYPAPRGMAGRTQSQQSQEPVDRFAAPISGLSSAPSRPQYGFKEYVVPHNELYTQLSDGSFEAKYDNYIHGTDNNERLAQGQTSGEKWKNGLIKFAGKTGTAVLGGTVGSVVGLGELITTGSLEAMYNNDYNQWLDTLNEKMDGRLPNYYTAQEQQEGFFGSLDNANFWANDLLGGLSFTIGTIVSEGIWAAATGGASLAASAARMGARAGIGGFKTAANLAKANSQAARVGKELLRSGQFSADKARKIGQTVEGLNTARFIYTSAGYEAGVEARTYMKEAENNYRHEFENQHGREPSPEEWASFQSDLHDSANAVFTANSVLVGASNLAVFGRMFDLPSPTGSLTKSLNKNLFGIGARETTKEGRVILEALKPTKMQKFAGKTFSVMEAPVIEGIWEEGMQAVTANTAENWLLSRHDKDGTETSLDMMESAYEGLAHTYGTKEGWKEIGLGMMIGFIGGGVANGGKFNGVSRAREDFKGKLDYLNTYSAENTLEAFKVQNQIAKAEKDIETAEQNNDLLGKDLATERLLYTHAKANARFGKKDGALDFEAAMEGLGDEYYESMGIDPQSATFEQEKKALKDDLLNQYKDSEKQYKTNIKTAEYLVGKGGIVGVENTQELIEAVAYNITMGTKADSVASALHDAIKVQMAGELGEKVSNALEAQTVLQRAHKRTRERFYYHRKNAKRAERDLEGALKKLQDLQTANKEDNPTLNQKIQKAQQEIVKYTEKQAEERELMRQTFGIAQSENPYNEGKVYETAVGDINSLEKADEYLAQGEEYLKGLKETNTTKYQALSKLFNEYHKANYAFTQFNDTVQGLASSELKLQEYNDAITKKVYKGKTNNEFTQEWIEKNLRAYQEGNQDTMQVFSGSQAIGQAQRREAIEEKLFEGQELTEEEKELYELFKEDIDLRVKSRNVAKKMMEQDFLEGDDLKFYQENKALVDNYINELEEGDGITPPKPEAAPKPKTLKERINETIKNDTAVQSYVGEDVDKVTAKKPTRQEGDELDDLHGRKMKTQTGRGRRPDPNVEPLSKEEEERYEALKTKFTMWRLVDGSIDPDGYSMYDMILAQEQENQTPRDPNIKTEITEEEAIDVKIIGDEDGTRTVDNIDFIQTYENVKVKVNKITNKFVFSHLNVGTILSKFGMNQIKVKSPKGSYKDLTSEGLNKYGKTEGAKFQITLQDSSKVILTIEEKGRISVATDEFNKISATTGMKLVNTNLTKNSYFDVYHEVDLGGEKKFVPMPSEFRLSTVTNSPEVLLEASEIEKLDKGEELTFRINMKSTWNHELFERLNREGISEDERAKVVKEINNSLEIYVMTSDNRVVGVVKSATGRISEGSDAQANHLALRQLAAQEFLAKSETADISPIDLGARIPVSKVLTGTPSLELKETSEGLTPVNIDFTDRAIEEVLDFGYMEGNKMHTNKGTDMTEVMTSPLKNLGKGKRVPFVVFQHGKNKLAYPVSLKTLNNFEGVEKVTEINNTSTLSASAKILKINEVLLENGLSPKKYQLMNATSKEIDGLIDQVMEDLANKDKAPSLEDWVDNADKSILKEEARISIDLENRPIKSPKLAVNFAAIDMPNTPGVQSEADSVQVPDQNQVNNQINNC